MAPTSIAGAVVAPEATTEGGAGGWLSVNAATSAAVAALIAAAAAPCAVVLRARAGTRRLVHGEGRLARKVMPAALPLMLE